MCECEDPPRTMLQIEKYSSTHEKENQKITACGASIPSTVQQRPSIIVEVAIVREQTALSLWFHVIAIVIVRVPTWMPAHNAWSIIVGLRQ